MLIAAVAGTIGALADSLFGATVQAAYWCPACREPTEAPRHARCGGPTRLVQGWSWIDNDAVNVLATTAGALAGATLDISHPRWRCRRGA